MCDNDSQCTNGTCSDTNQCACDESAGFKLVGKMRKTNENKRLKNLNATMRGGDDSLKFIAVSRSISGISG